MSVILQDFGYISKNAVSNFKEMHADLLKIAHEKDMITAFTAPELEVHLIDVKTFIQNCTSLPTYNTAKIGLLSGFIGATIFVLYKIFLGAK